MVSCYPTGSARKVVELYSRITKRESWGVRIGRLTPDETDAMKILENGRYEWLMGIG